MSEPPLVVFGTPCSTLGWWGATRRALRSTSSAPRCPKPPSDPTVGLNYITYIYKYVYICIYIYAYINIHIFLHIYVYIYIQEREKERGRERERERTALSGWGHLGVVGSDAEGAAEHLLRAPCQPRCFQRLQRNGFRFSRAMLVNLGRCLGCRFAGLLVCRIYKSLQGFRYAGKFSI